MFEDLMTDIQATFTERYLKVQVNAEPPRRPPPVRAPQPVQSEEDALFATPGSRGRPAGGLQQGAPGTATKAAPAALTTSLGRVPTGEQVPAVGRNDPCPCGSGKKYKKCHGAAN
jgi:preprotein translocase subunit SecA